MDAHWQEIVHSDYDQPMPFDEPALGIIGMWTMGGGPNPHFALALGCMMEEVGQPSIAWEAYERAVELSDSFWPDAGVRQKMIDFCRSRQNRLAESESSSDPGAWQTKMRQRHGDELAWGLAYQKAYQDYEASQIAAGVPLDDPQFYAGFFKGRPPIASNPGQADDLIVNRSNALPLLALGLGLGMALALVIPERHLS
jgi:hypothetical protein